MDSVVDNFEPSSEFGIGSDLHYRVGFSTAEALTPALRADLQQTFGIELFDHCGEAQIGALAAPVTTAESARPSRSLPRRRSATS